MKIIANQYDATEVIKMIREWCEMSQKEFGESINYSRRAVQSYELGVRKYTFETLLDIAKKHDITITIEKKNVLITKKLNVGKNAIEKAKDEVH